MSDNQTPNSENPEEDIDEYAQLLEEVRREGNITLDLNHQSMSNHLAQSAQVIAGLQTLEDNDSKELELLEALVKDPFP